MLHGLVFQGLSSCLELDGTPLVLVGVGHRGVAGAGNGSRIGRFLASPIAGEYFGPGGVIRRGVLCQVVGVLVIVIVNVSGVGVRRHWVRNNSIGSQRKLNVFVLSVSGGNRGDGGGGGVGLVSGLGCAL